MIYHLCPQVKIELPTQLHEKHHLLFSFYHVTCDINAKTNAKRKEALETPGERVKDLEAELFWNINYIAGYVVIGLFH